MAPAALAVANPDSLVISPSAGFIANGPIGGPFNFASENFSLTNVSTSAFGWMLVNTSAWLNASPASGTLTPGGAATTVTVSLNAASSNFAAGTYRANILFTNLSTHLVQTRAFTLSVTPLSANGNAVLALQPLAYWRLNETNQPPPAAVATNAGSLGGVGTGFDFSGVVAGQPGIVGTSFRLRQSVA